MTAMLPSRPPGEDHATRAGEVVDPDTVLTRPAVGEAPRIVSTLRLPRRRRGREIVAVLDPVRARPLAGEHPGEHPGDHQREIARADLRFEGLRLRLMQQPVGPAQRPHAHPEALDRHRHADHLQRRERHHVQFAQGVEDRHEHHASAGARRIGDDRACQADTGEKPQAPHQAARYRHQ